MSFQRQKESRIGVLLPFFEKRVRQGQDSRIRGLPKGKQALPAARTDVLRERGETVIAKRAHGCFFLKWPSRGKRPFDGSLSLFRFLRLLFPKKRESGLAKSLFSGPVGLFRDRGKRDSPLQFTPFGRRNP